MRTIALLGSIATAVGFVQENKPHLQGHLTTAVKNAAVGVAEAVAAGGAVVAMAGSMGSPSAGG